VDKELQLQLELKKSKQEKQQDLALGRETRLTSNNVVSESPKVIQLDSEERSFTVSEQNSNNQKMRRHIDNDKHLRSNAVITSFNPFL
jgi:hypothetical protein